MNTLIDILVSLGTLTLLEIILGMDNLVFLTLISHKLPKSQQKKARRIGLTLAWTTRLMLLAFAVAITKLTYPVFNLLGQHFSFRDLFLLGGGVFLLFKATQEIQEDIEPPKRQTSAKQSLTFAMAVTQIALLDIVFSLDSVLTAVGLTQRFWLMATAITIAIIGMLFASEQLSRFIERHPTLKILALSFLLLIGVVLIAEGLGHPIPRLYIYFALGFALFIELLNIIKCKSRVD